MWESPPLSVLATTTLAAVALAGCSGCPKPRTEAPKPVAAAASSAPTASVCPPPAAPSDPELDADADDDDGEGEEQESEYDAEEPPDPAQAAEWRWVKERFPEVAKYEQLDPGLLDRLLGWAKPRERIAVWDRACHPGYVRRTGDKLHGTVNRSFQLIPGDPDGMSMSYTEIQMGWSFDEFPSNWNEYKRDRQGNWQHQSSSGYGDGRIVAHQLSAVTEEAAWYDNAPITLTIACKRVVEEDSACKGGGRRVCNRCEGWGPVPATLSSSFGISRHPQKRRVKGTAPVDCSTPCAPLDEPPDVARANAALKKEDFVYPVSEEPKPVVFRTEAACKAYTKKHPFDADDLLLWQGDNVD